MNYTEYEDFVHELSITKGLDTQKSGTEKLRLKNTSSFELEQLKLSLLKTEDEFEHGN